MHFYCEKLLCLWPETGGPLRGSRCTTCRGSSSPNPPSTNPAVKLWFCFCCLLGTEKHKRVPPLILTTIKQEEADSDHENVENTIGTDSTEDRTRDENEFSSVSSSVRWEVSAISRPSRDAQTVDQPVSTARQQVQEVTMTFFSGVCLCSISIVTVGPGERPFSSLWH